jgi:hypothetical protein
MSSITDILPALIGFSIGIALILFLKPNSPRTIILSSFMFISSGFLCSLLVKNYENTKKLLDFPILSAALATLFANYGIQFLKNKEEQKKTAIVFINSIKSQLISLQFINSLLDSKMSLLDLKNSNSNSELIKIYINRLLNQERFKNAFNSIGIYDQLSIDVILEYDLALENSLSYINEFLLKKSQSKIDFMICKIEVMRTFLLGHLCIFIFNVKYTEKNKLNSTNKFVHDYYSRITELTNSINIEKSGIKIDELLLEHIINTLKDIRKSFQKINNIWTYSNIVSVDSKSLYIVKECTNGDNCKVLVLKESKEDADNYKTEIIDKGIDEGIEIVIDELPLL